jgi:hypothetical protein
MATAYRPLEPETLAMLKAVFEEACDVLPPHQRTSEARSNLASSILKRATQGGMSPAQLRAYALLEAASLTSKWPRTFVHGPDRGRRT